MKKLIILLALLLLSQSVLFSHPGRTDKNGGHRGPNGYHYHNGGTRSSAATSPSVAPADEVLTKAVDISAVQTLLKELGFYNGEITGVADEETLRTANEARIRYGLSGTPSVIRRSLLNRLTVESGGA